MLSATSRLCSLLFLAALATGCASDLDFEVLEPARYNLGAGRQLTVLQTEGRDGARQFLVEQLGAKAQRDGFFRMWDRSNEGMVVQRMGDYVTVYNSRAPEPQPDEIGVRLDLLDWVSFTEERVTRETDSQGRTYEEREVVYHGRVAFKIIAFDPSGRVLMGEVEYGSEATGPNADEAMRVATEESLKALMGEITPRRVRVSVDFDSEDKAQESILKLAMDGQIGVAIEQMQAYVAAQPDRASAHYNLGVMLDSQARYQEALASYDRAIALANERLYRETRDGCARRLANAQALGLQ